LKVKGEKKKRKGKVDWAFDIKINFLGFMYGCLASA
jgi:hypothetical protein